MLYMFTCLNLNCKKDFYLADPDVVGYCPYCSSEKPARPFRQSTYKRYKAYYELFTIIPQGTEYLEELNNAYSRNSSRSKGSLTPFS